MTENKTNVNRRHPRVFYPGRDFLASMESAGKYVFHEMIKPFWKWIVLYLSMCVPILSFLPRGMILKAADRREHVDFNRAGKSFGKGFGFTVISLIYLGLPALLVYSLVAVVLALFLYQALEGGFGWYAVLGIAGMLLLIALSVASILFYFPAVINYSRNTFGYAFHFRENLRMIKSAGWGRYLLSVLFILFMSFCYGAAVIGFMFGIASSPYGSVSWVVLLDLLLVLAGIFLIPVLFTFVVRFFANLFPDTCRISDEECLSRIDAAIQKTTGLRDVLEEHSVFQEYEWIDVFLRDGEKVKIIRNILRKDENLVLSSEDIRYYMRVWFYGKCQ